jgi:hypothetical protein
MVEPCPILHVLYASVRMSQKRYLGLYSLSVNRMVQQAQFCESSRGFPP